MTHDGIRAAARAPARKDRAEKIALFRYQLIREAADTSLTTRQRGPMVRALAAASTPALPGKACGTRARHWTGGSAPGSGRVRRAQAAGKGRRPGDPGERAGPGSGAEAGEPGPHRGAGAPDPGRDPRCAPSEWTLQRHFRRLELMGPHAAAPAQVFGRFEADRPERDLGRRRAARPADRRPQDVPVRVPRRPFTAGDRGTGWASPRTPCGWPPRCARRWPTRGVPDAVYVDNGSRLSWTRGCCGPARSSGIRLVHSAPGRPQGRGKIERFFPHRARPVPRRDHRLDGRPRTSAAAGVDRRHRLAELNGLFTAWVETVYHRRVHSETGQTPLARWARAGTGRPCPPGTGRVIAEAFLWSETADRHQDRDGVAARQHLPGRPAAGRHARSNWSSTRST